MKPIHVTLVMAALGACALVAADQPVTLKSSPAPATHVTGFPRISTPSDAAAQKINLANCWFSSFMVLDCRKCSANSHASELPCGSYIHRISQP